MLVPKPGEKPYLIQEEVKDDPWKVLVVCILLNRTRGEQVFRVVWDLFRKYPTAQSMADANLDELKEMVKPLGLSTERSLHLKLMSHQWVNDAWDEITDLSGCGKYAQDSYEIFVDGDLDVDTDDPVLLMYIMWAKKNKREWNASRE